MIFNLITAGTNHSRLYGWRDNMAVYSEDYTEIAKMIVRKNVGENKEIKSIYIKDGRVNVETEE